MIWKSPQAFALLVPLIFLAWWGWRSYYKKTPSLKFSSLLPFRDIPSGWRVRLMKLPLLLKYISLVIAIFAMARPQVADVKIKKNIEGIDIVIALDVSDSMLIEDMQPENRLELAKLTIKDFITGRVSDRIGLIVFSGEAYTRVPLTLDYELLLKNLAEVKTTSSIKMGTALGVALANATARLKDSTAKNRVVIFLTDGENNSGTIDPETALEIAKGYQIKIYSIGVGRDGNTRIPVFTTDPQGNKVKRYQQFYSKVNEDLLGRMASETSGKYYRATTANSLQRIFQDIDGLEKTKIEVNKYTRYRELFAQPLAWAFWLYLAASIAAFTIFRSVP